MIRSWQTATLVVKNGELQAADLAVVRDFAEARSFDIVHLPGMRAEEADRFNQLGEAYFLKFTGSGTHADSELRCHGGRDGAGTVGSGGFGGGGRPFPGVSASWQVRFSRSHGHEGGRADPAQKPR